MKTTCILVFTLVLLLGLACQTDEMKKDTCICKRADTEALTFIAFRDIRCFKMCMPKSSSLPLWITVGRNSEEKKPMDRFIPEGNVDSFLLYVEKYNLNIDMLSIMNSKDAHLNFTGKEVYIEKIDIFQYDSTVYIDKFFFSKMVNLSFINLCVYNIECEEGLIIPPSVDSLGVTVDVADFFEKADSNSSVQFIYINTGILKNNEFDYKNLLKFKKLKKICTVKFVHENKKINIHRFKDSLARIFNDKVEIEVVCDTLP